MHIQLQLENRNNPEWWDDYCRKMLEWARTKRGNPPDVVQDAEKDHEHIGEDAEANSRHKDFLDELKKLNE